jgi:hypothetical protein
MLKKLAWAVIVAAGAFGAALGGSFAAGAIHGNQQSPTTQTCVRGPFGPGPGMLAAGGKVTDISGSTITVTMKDGSKKTVKVDSTTKYDKEGQSASLADIHVGDTILVQGTANSDGSVKASQIEIAVPMAGGNVTAVNGSTFTVAGPTFTDPFGGKHVAGPSEVGAVTTIVTSGSTKFVNFDNTSATLADVKVGTYIVASGTISSDGKTMQADRVRILPANANGWHAGGFFGHGFFGGQSTVRPGQFGGFGQDNVSAPPAFWGSGPGA